MWVPVALAIAACFRNMIQRAYINALAEYLRRIEAVLFVDYEVDGWENYYEDAKGWGNILYRGFFWGALIGGAAVIAVYLPHYIS